MKKSFQKIGNKLFFTVALLAAFQATALANNEVSGDNSGQSPFTIAALVALLITLLVLPAVKGSQRVTGRK